MSGKALFCAYGGVGWIPIPVPPDPAGRIRLRVRVALVAEPLAPVQFRLTVGSHVIEGPVNGSWPTESGGSVR